MYNFDFNFIKNGTPIATLSSLGISFNHASINLLGNPERILVGYDAAAHVIGIKAATPEDSGAIYEFAAREKNGWVRIGCKDFIKHLALETSLNFDKKAIQFLVSFDRAINMLIIQVDEQHIKTK